MKVDGNLGHSVCPILCMDKFPCTTEGLSNHWGTYMYQPSIHHMLQIYEADLSTNIDYDRIYGEFYSTYLHIYVILACIETLEYH